MLWLANSATTICLWVYGATYSLTKAKRAICDVAQFVADLLGCSSRVHNVLTTVMTRIVVDKATVLRVWEILVNKNPTNHYSYSSAVTINLAGLQIKGWIKVQNFGSFANLMVSPLVDLVTWFILKSNLLHWIPWTQSFCNLKTLKNWRQYINAIVC